MLMKKIPTISNNAYLYFCREYPDLFFAVMTMKHASMLDNMTYLRTKANLVGF